MKLWLFVAPFTNVKLGEAPLGVAQWFLCEGGKHFTGVLSFNSKIVTLERVGGMGPKIITLERSLGFGGQPSKVPAVVPRG